MPVVLMSCRFWVRGLFALAAFSAACGGTRSTPGGPSEPPPITPQTAILVGAGDIADCGNNGGIHARDTGKMLDTMVSDAIFTAGDNAYMFGSTEDYKNCYDPAWGRFKSKTYPVPGNHEYAQPGALPPWCKVPADPVTCR